MIIDIFPSLAVTLLYDHLIFPQTLNIQTDGGKKSLTFIPLAPACVVSTSTLVLLLHFLSFISIYSDSPPLIFQKRSLLMKKGYKKSEICFLCVQENGV